MDFNWKLFWNVVRIAFGAVILIAAFVLLIYSLQEVYHAENWKKEFVWSVVFAAGFLSVYGLQRIITVDYGFWGVMVPVFASFAHLRKFPYWASVLLFRRDKLRKEYKELQMTNAAAVRTYQQALHYVGLDFHFKE